MKKYFLALCALLLLPTPTNATEPAILINEIAWMGTLVSSNDEWLELYNPTDTDIDLTNWRLEAADGSPIINLEGTIKAGEYFLLERTDDETVPNITADQIYTGALGNTGEWLKLYDADNKLVDEINATEAWPGGDNTTKQTLQKINGAWQTSAEPGGTPKAQNSDSSPSPEEPPEAENENDEDNDENDDEANDPEEKPAPAPPKPTVKKGDVIINEIFPNPDGPDDNEKNSEFIELKNVSEKIIDLTGWQLKNSYSQIFDLPPRSLFPNEIIAFFRPQTNLSLNNDKEKITLYSQAGKIIDQRQYSKSGPIDISYQKGSDNNWLWGEISPNQDNTAKKIIPPKVVIDGPTEISIKQIVTFDGSDSFDPENRKLSFQWQFGDGRIAKGIFARQIYLEPGKYEVLLTVTADNLASSTEKLKVTVIGNDQINTSTPTSTEPATENQTFASNSIPFVFISEFLPNPEGPDQKSEFIELFNQDNVLVNLGGWQIDDMESGSKPFTIPPNTIIKPGQYLAFYRPQTKIALNNSDEAVRLFTPNQTMVDYVDYEESKEGQSYVLDEQFNWQQTNTPTPGEINILDQIEEETEEKSAESGSASDGRAEPKKPTVLGIGTQELIEPEKLSAKTKRYWFSGISAAAILGAGFALKRKIS